MTTETEIQTEQRAYTVASRAMLVSLSIHKWQASKKDKQITKSTNQYHRVQQDMGRYIKRLMVEGALDEFTTLEGQARQVIYELSMPWQEDKVRIIPNENILDCRDRIVAIDDQWKLAETKFFDNYEAYCASSKAQLGDAYNPKDYPTLEKIKKKFGFKLVLNQIPEQGDFRTSLSGDAYKYAVDTAISSREDQERTVVEHSMSKIRNHVEKMVERLTVFTPGQRQGYFKDTLVDNIKELCDVLPIMNITGNPKIDELIKNLQDDLCKHTPDDLREDELKRLETKDKADAILKRMSSYGF